MPPSKKVARPKLPKLGESAAPRARTEVSDAEARTVRATVNAADPSTSQQADKPAKREVDKTTYYIPREVADEIVILARRRRTSASAVATEALQAYVDAAKAKAAG